MKLSLVLSRDWVTRWKLFWKAYVLNHYTYCLCANGVNFFACLVKETPYCKVSACPFRTLIIKSCSESRLKFPPCLSFSLRLKWIFYVTDGNIMYLTDASRFLISCVIQHYAPLVGWDGVEEQMHNVDYDPGP